MHLDAEFRSRNVVWPVGRCLALAALLLAAVAPKAQAQDAAAPAEVGGPHAVWEVDLDQRKNEEKVKAIRRQTQFADGDQELVRTFFEKYSLARWTQPENRARLAEAPPARGFRRELRNELQLAKGAVHDGQNLIVLKILAKMAADNVHPPARFNAMIAIGEINAVEPAAPGDPGRPLPATIPELLKGLSDPNQIDAVRVAALVGLLRHAKAKIPPEDPNHAAVSAACLALLQTTAPPAGRTPEGHGWMRAQAAEILGELGGTTGVANVATALGAMAGETALSVSNRRLAVRALGKLNLSGANVANGAELVGSVARFVFDALSLENPANLSKRRLRQSMLAAQECVTAIKTVATDAPSRQVLGVLEPAVTALADATEGSDAALLEAITKQRAALQPLLR